MEVATFHIITMHIMLTVLLCYPIPTNRVKVLYLVSIYKNQNKWVTILYQNISFYTIIEFK